LTDTSQLLDAHAHQIVASLADGRISALALCEATIARIEARDAAINAVVVRDFDRARDQARAADQRLIAGERAPLLGLPMTVKESFNIAGLPTTWGFPFAKDLRARQDAVAVQRLKAAGAVILGKTNVPVGLADWQSFNTLYGRTVNPLDASRTPGGSSGGAAAAVAAGMVALEVGSDIGGSIRVPAHFCGIYGHKPSIGLLPARGHDFPGYATGAPNELAVIGPLARSAQDLMIAMDVLAGPEEPFSRAYPLRLPPARELRAARVLLLTAHPGVAVSTDIVQAIERVAGALENTSCRISRQSPLLPDLQAARAVYAGLLNTYMTRGSPGAPPSMPAHDWLLLLDRRAALQAQWHAFFGEFDLVLAPTLGCTAYPHVEQVDWTHNTLPIDGRDEPMSEQIFWASIATLPGLPATVAPIGRDRQGLPIGLQIIGPLFEDRTPLAMAAHIQSMALA
jgi:amidase